MDKHLYGQITAYLELQQLVRLKHRLSPLRGWAASPDFLLEIAESALLNKPKTIVECSSGSSSVILARCCQLNSTGHVYSLEHDLEFYEKTKYQIEKHGLTDYCTVLHAPLTPLENFNGQPWYDISRYNDLLKGIDMLIIDGPPNQPDMLAREPAYNMLKKSFNKNIKIFLDDANRDEEKEMLTKWLKKDSNLIAENLHCEKGAKLIYWKS
ncbi:class I SAM-dependent methyltransferase [Colwellia sp. MEBiC06753]